MKLRKLLPVACAGVVLSFALAGCSFSFEKEWKPFAGGSSKEVEQEDVSGAIDEESVDGPASEEPSGTVGGNELQEPDDLDAENSGEVADTEASDVPDRKYTGDKELNEWVDMEDRLFMVNGKVYQLGVDTLQDMIDDGVPFDEEDIQNAGNNLKANMESEGFGITLGDYWTAQVYVINDTDEGKPIADCKLSCIYMPVRQDEEQDVIDFAFPLDLTEDELVAECGEPSDRYDYEDDDSDYVSHELKYQESGEKYYGSTGYDFEFTNGLLSYVTINWSE